jgi:hypothetical protein
MKASLLTTLLTTSSVLVGAALLAKGESAGLFTDASVADTAPSKAVLSRYKSASGTVDDFLASQSGSAKLVYDVSGNLVWSPHNMLLQSEDFTQSWTPSTGTSVTQHVITDNSGTLFGSIAQNVTSIIGETYTWTCWVVKNSSSGTFPLFELGNTSQLALNTATGATTFVTNPLNATVSVTDGGTYWILSLTVVANAGSFVYRLYGAAETSFGVNSSATTGSVQIDKTQVNRGAVPTTYLATTTVARYGLARDYDPITHTALGLKSEPAATNLVLQSQDLSAGSYGSTNTTVTADAILAPDGRTTADRIVETAVTGIHSRYQSITIANATVYTWSAYLKAGERTWAYIDASDGTDHISWFDLANGVMGSSDAGNTATMQSVGNGWYRCSVTRTSAGTVGAIAVGIATGNSVTSFAGSTSNGIYAWQYQLETGSSATSPIPTFAATQTRVADKNYLNPSFFPASQIAGSWIVDTTIVSTFGRVIGETISNTQLYMANPTSVGIYNGVTVLAKNITGGATFATGMRAASAWDATGRSVTGAGLTPATDTLVQTPPTSLFIGQQGDGSQATTGYTRSVRYLARRATDAELAAWTNATAVPASEPGIAIDFQANTVSVVGTDLYYALDQFYTNAGTSPKQVYDKTGALVWSAHNVCLQSQDFDNATWDKSTVSTVVADTTAAPDGSVSADRVVETNVNNNHFVRQTIAEIVGAQYTYSVYTKAGERGWLSLSDDGTRRSWFNLSTGALGTVNAGHVATITPAAVAGWYLCSITYASSTASTTRYIYLNTSDNETSGYVGDVTKGLYIWGAQHNRGPVRVAYLRTTTAARYGLAVDYDPITHACKGPLSEAAATNGYLQSVDLTSAQWTPTAGTVAKNVADPTGLVNTATTFTEDTTTGGHGILAFGTNRPTMTAVPWTFSVFLKAGTRRYVNISFENSGNGYNITVDIQTWTITNAVNSGTGWTYGSSSIQNIGGGWFRVSLTGTPAAVGVTTFIYGNSTPTGGRSQSYTGDGSTIIMALPQIELGSVATSPIPTFAATVTRAADDYKVSTAAFPYNASAETVIIEGQNFALGSGGSSGYISLSDGTTNNIHQIRQVSSSIQDLVLLGGVIQANNLITASLSSVLKVASALALNDNAFCLNGGSVTTDVSVGLPTGVNILNLGKTPGSSGAMTGYIRKCVYLPRRMSNSDMQLKTAA